MADEVTAAFFDRPVEIVAPDLIGRCLRVSGSEIGIQRAVIVETEAYGDASDSASHAAFRPGGRASIMAGPPGLVYVYSAYGMYPCLNFVTGPEGHASAVLIRGVWRHGDAEPVFGPGRTTRILGITLDDHTQSVPGTRFGVGLDRMQFSISCTERVGISRAIDTLWRFVAKIENTDAR